MNNLNIRRALSFSLPVLIAVLSLLLTCFITPSAPAIAAEDIPSDIEQALLKAVPQMSEMPTGYGWDNYKFLPPEKKGGLIGTSGIRVGWLAGRKYTTSEERGWVDPNSDRVPHDPGYLIVFQNSYCTSKNLCLFPSADDFRKEVMKHPNASPFNDIPGGVIINFSSEDQVHTSISLSYFFWKSPLVCGSVNGSVGVAKCIPPCKSSSPPYAERLRFAQELFRNELPRLSKLVWSRLPGEAPGGIYIKSTPGDAEVWINGKKYANTNYQGAPYGITDLPPGKYTVTFRKQGFNNYTKTVQLAANQIETVDARLEAGTMAPLPSDKTTPGTTTPPPPPSDGTSDTVSNEALLIASLAAGLAALAGAIATTAAQSAAALVPGQSGPSVKPTQTQVKPPPTTPPAPSSEPPALGTERGGMVYYERPGDDEGGPSWWDKSRYLEIRKMEAQGLVYSNKLGGWVPPDEKNRFDSSMDEFQKKALDYQSQEHDRIMTEVAEQKAKLQASREALDKANMDWLKAKQSAQEATSQVDTIQAQDYYLNKPAEDFNKMLELTKREIFTQKDADGNFSWKSAGLRMLLGAATGGYSEAAYIPTDISYRTMDKVDQGYTQQELKQAFEDKVKDGKSPEDALNEVRDMEQKGKSFEEALGESSWEVGKETAYGYGIFGGIKYGIKYAPKAAGWIGSYAANTETGKYIINAASPYVKGAADKIIPYISDAKQGVKDGIKWFGEKDEAFQNWWKGADDAVPGGGSTPLSARPPLNPELAAAKQRIDDVLKISDPDKQAAAIADLYKDGKLKNLSELQRAGEIPDEVARKVNSIMTGKVNTSVTESTINNIKQFQSDTGVRIEEVHMVDSGSSARAAAASTPGAAIPRSSPAVNMDHDLTSVVKWNKEDVLRYAKNHFNGNVAEAEKALNAQFVSKQTEHFKDALDKNTGLTPKDVKSQFYDGFGKPSGQADAVPSGRITTDAAAWGKDQVFKVDASGNIRTYNTTGEAATMQNSLNKAAYNPETRTYGGDPSLIKTGPKMLPDEVKDIVKQIDDSLPNCGEDMDKWAKNLERIDKAAHLSKLPGVDPELRAFATDLHKYASEWFTKLPPEEQQKYVKLFADEIQRVMSEIK